MPSIATVRRGPGHYTYDGQERQDRLDNAGAHSLDRDYENAQGWQLQAAEMEYKRMHAELEQAKLERQLVHDRAVVEHRIKYEKMMEQAIPKLYAIDPADPKANEKRAAVVKEFPQLMHNEPGIPSMSKDVEQHQRLSESARRQDTTLDAKAAAADLRAQHATEMQEQRAQHAKDLVQLRAEAKKAAGPSDAVKLRYQQATEKAANAQKQMEGTQAFIDELDKKGEKRSPEEDKRLVDLEKSRNKWEGILNSETGMKNAFETTHPELASPRPALPTEGDRPPDTGETEPPEPAAAGTPGPTGVTNAVAPVNPNLTPAVEPVSASAIGEEVAPVEAASAPAAVAPVVPAPAPATVPLTPVGTPDLAPNTGVTLPAPAAEPHPYEGKRVLQKSTGKYGVFTNGQFVPEQ